jgi:hypothetical protein
LYGVPLIVLCELSILPQKLAGCLPAGVPL